MAECINLSSILLCAAIKFGHREYAMAQGLGGRITTIGSSTNHFNQFIPKLIDGQITAQNTRYINKLAHRANDAWVCRGLDYRHDRIADHVALTGWESVQHIFARSHVRDAFSAFGGNPQFS